MSITTAAPTDSELTVVPDAEPPREPVLGGWRAALTRPDPKQVALSIGALVGSLVLFSIVTAVKGADPFSIYSTMLHSAVLDHGTLSQTLLRSIPIALAALAVAVPARAGLVNVGGEGQITLGAVAATGVGVAIGSHAPRPLSWAAMAKAGALARAVRARVARVLRSTLHA